MLVQVLLENFLEYEMLGSSACSPLPRQSCKMPLLYTSINAAATSHYEIKQDQDILLGNQQEADS